MDEVPFICSSDMHLKLEQPTVTNKTASLGYSNKTFAKENNAKAYGRNKHKLTLK